MGFLAKCQRSHHPAERFWWGDTWRQATHDAIGSGFINTESYWAGVTVQVGVRSVYPEDRPHVSPEEEVLTKGLLEEEDEGALKSMPSSSSVYDLPAFTSLLCSHWLAAGERGGDSLGLFC